MVFCNCCGINKDVKKFNSGYRYICDKCFNSGEYKKIKEEYIY